MSFFSSLEIETYLEQKNNIGKIFPTTDSAKNILALLENEIDVLGIEKSLNSKVISIEKNENLFTIIAGNDFQKFISKNVIVSVGGMTYPALGSDGSLYDIIQKFGHTIIDPVPSAVPLVSKNVLSHMLQGVKIYLEVTSYVDNKKIKSDTNDVIFTQYGLSGSGILNISRDISIYINRFKGRHAEVSLNFFPNKTPDSALHYLDAIWERHPEWTILNSLLGFIPIKVAQALLEVINIYKNMVVKNFTQEQKFNLISRLCDYRFKIIQTRGWNEAEFTAGGVKTSEIDSNLESKKVKGLYFCGEIIDVDGDVGGYNISWAFCSGGSLNINSYRN